MVMHSEIENNINKKSHTLRKPLWGGGPLGLGDPEDKRLRRVEKDILIPRKLREEAIKKCADIVEAFVNCSKENGLLVLTNCREENKKQLDCISKWMKNEEFSEKVTNDYLNERSYYRKTGLVYKSQE